MTEQIPASEEDRESAQNDREKCAKPQPDTHRVKNRTATNIRRL